MSFSKHFLLKASIKSDSFLFSFYLTDHLSSITFAGFPFSSSQVSPWYSSLLCLHSDPTWSYPVPWLLILSMFYWLTNLYSKPDTLSELWPHKTFTISMSFISQVNLFFIQQISSAYNVPYTVKAQRAQQWKQNKISPLQCLIGTSNIIHNKSTLISFTPKSAS